MTVGMTSMLNKHALGCLNVLLRDSRYLSRALDLFCTANRLGLPPTLDTNTDLQAVLWWLIVTKYSFNSFVSQQI